MRVGAVKTAAEVVFYPIPLKPPSDMKNIFSPHIMVHEQNIDHDVKMKTPKILV